MATKEEILDVLETLIHAYPGYKYSENTFKIYIDHFSDIQPDLLRLTVKNLIDTSTWFPRVSEIRAEAARIAGHSGVTNWDPQPITPLSQIFYQLEHDFFHYRILDEDTWLALAKDYDRQDRIYGTAKIRERLAIFQQILAEEEAEQAV